MTLILSLAQPEQAFQVIDRQVSLQRRSGQITSVHDAYFNKTVIVRGVDGLCSCSFTGRAYLGKIPVDNALAESILGEELDPQVLTTTHQRLPALSLWELLEAGAERFFERWSEVAKTDEFFQLECVGLQKKSGRLMPFLRRYTARDGRPLGTSPLPRTRGRNACHLTVAGSGLNALPDQELIDDLQKNPGSNGDLDALVAALGRASKAEASVGPDAMFVQIVPESFSKPETGRTDKAIAFSGYITEREGEEALLFSPWYLGQGAIRAPSVDKLGEAQGITDFLRRRGREVKTSILDRAVWVSLPLPRTGPPGRDE